MSHPPARSPLLSGWLLQAPLQVEGSAAVAKLAKLFMMNEIKASATSLMISSLDVTWYYNANFSK
jgi:hypothetical protein